MRRQRLIDTWKADSTVFADKYTREEEARIVGRLSELRTMPFTDYLQPPEWQATRLEALKRANYRCENCGKEGEPLDVHHDTYERLGCEEPADLMAVCRACHEALHTATPAETVALS